MSVERDGAAVGCGQGWLHREGFIHGTPKARMQTLSKLPSSPARTAEAGPAMGQHARRFGMIRRHQTQLERRTGGEELGEKPV